MPTVRRGRLLPSAGGATAARPVLNGLMTFVERPGPQQLVCAQEYKRPVGEVAPLVKLALTAPFGAGAAARGNRR